MSDDDDDEWLKRFLEEEERLLTKGDELQKLSVIGSLPELLKYDQKGTVTKIIPKIQQELPNSSSEFNLAVSRMFNILIHMDIPVNLVPQILQGIENRDPIIANAWMETLLAVIPVLKEATIKNEILKCAISKSQLSKPAYFRVSSCRILGKISLHKYMNPFEVKKDVLPLVQSLCQDCFHEVRAAMCKELPGVAQGLFNLGDAIVKVNLLPLLVELSADENVYVRSVAIEAVVAIIPYLSSETIKGTIIPLTKKLCTKSAAEGDTTYIAIASVFSSLIVNLQPHMTPSDGMWFLDYYNHICRKGQSAMEDVDTDPSVCMLCRENCALCLPTVATMVFAQIPSEISVKFYHNFKTLAADPCYIVRKAVASCFASVVKILGHLNKIVIIDFTKLLREEDEEVLQALIPNIANILESFTAVGALQRDAVLQATSDICRAMQKCYEVTFKTHNWRMKERLLVQWEYLPNSFPSDFIHEHFSTLVLNAAVRGKAKPVRSQATRTLLIILKYSLKENHRKWIREMISNQLCYGHCCYSRQMYVTLCIHALDIFSWRYFKEYFYLPLLSLAEDPVCIVRLCMVKLCPVLKQMLILPADRALQLQLENILSKMEMTESDKDVIMMLKQKLKEMRSIRTVNPQVVHEDRRKADEEDRILKGKWTLVKVGGQKEEKATMTALKPGSGKIPTKRLADGTTSPIMPFLDQHFYTDAGVSLSQDFSRDNNFCRNTKSPTLKTSTEVSKLITSAEHLTSWLDNISMTDEVISLNEKDLPTNMTDELKAKMSEIPKRPKRNSGNFEKVVKRRSLNLPVNSESRIPVVNNRLSYHEKSKSEQDLNKEIVNDKLLSKSSVNLQEKCNNKESRIPLTFKRYSASQENISAKGLSLIRRRTYYK